MFFFRKSSPGKKTSPTPVSVRTRRLRMLEQLEDRNLCVGNLIQSLLPIPAPNPVPTDDHFGEAVAASGNLIAVGSPLKDVGGVADIGKVYVFDRAGSSPTTPIFEIVNPAPGNGTDIGVSRDVGTSVALSGNLLAVGAPYDDPGGTSDAGTVYVYDLGSATPTTPKFKINNPQAGEGDFFGFSVAISSEFLVVGAPSSDAVDADAGAVYAFNLRAADPNTTVFSLDSTVGGAGDNFGFSVAIAGFMAIVGSPGEDTGPDDSGRAYLFNLWSTTRSTATKVYADPTPGVSELFGMAVSISGSNLEKYERPEPPTRDNLVASYVAIGTPFNLRLQTPTDTVRPGSVNVFNIASASLAPFYTVVNPSPSATGNDEFGDSVAITRNYLVVGAHKADRSDQLTDTGAAYIYELNSTTVAATLTSRTPAIGDFFGESVAATSNIVVVGIPFDDTQSTNQGAANVYLLDTEVKRGELVRFDSLTGEWIGLDFDERTPIERRLEQWVPDPALPFPLFWKTGLTGDIDGDGKLDLIGELSNGQMWVKLSSNSASAPLGNWRTNMTNIQVADVNGDGLDDIVGFYPTLDSWWALISNGSYLTLTYLTIWDNTTTTFVDPLVGDFMEDGCADIMGRDANTGIWWITDFKLIPNPATPTFPTWTSTTFAWGQWARTIGGNAITWLDVAAADFSGDGRLDITGRLEIAPNPIGEWWVSARPGNSLAAHQKVGTRAKALGYNNAHFDEITGDSRAEIFGQSTGGVWTSGGTSPFTDVFATLPGLVPRSHVWNIDVPRAQEILMISTDDRVRVVRGTTAAWSLLKTHPWTFGVWLYEGAEDRLW